jgi:hypothetical protein
MGVIESVILSRGGGGGSPATGRRSCFGRGSFAVFAAQDDRCGEGGR